MTQQVQVADWSLRRPWLVASQVYRWQAIQVANVLRQHKQVLDVLVFGSLARGEVGNDIDLILIANDDFAYSWLDETMVRMEELEQVQARKVQLWGLRRDGAYHYTSLRRQVAIEILGLSFRLLLNKTALIVSREQLDIFVFPPNWKERLQDLQDALPHKDPEFMQNIARDAVII